MTIDATAAPTRLVDANALVENGDGTRRGFELCSRCGKRTQLSAPRWPGRKSGSVADGRNATVSPGSQYLARAMLQRRACLMANPAAKAWNGPGHVRA
jgi:hypothetical protein